MFFAPALIVKGSCTDPHFCTMVLVSLLGKIRGFLGFNGCCLLLDVCFTCKLRGWEQLLYSFRGMGFRDEIDETVRFFFGHFMCSELTGAYTQIGCA